MCLHIFSNGPIVGWVVAGTSSVVTVGFPSLSSVNSNLDPARLLIDQIVDCVRHGEIIVRSINDCEPGSDCEKKVWKCLRQRARARKGLVGNIGNTTIHIDNSLEHGTLDGIGQRLTTLRRYTKHCQRYNRPRLSLGFNPIISHWWWTCLNSKSKPLQNFCSLPFHRHLFSPPRVHPINRSLLFKRLRPSTECDADCFHSTKVSPIGSNPSESASELFFLSPSLPRQMPPKIYPMADQARLPSGVSHLYFPHQMPLTFFPPPSTSLAHAMNFEILKLPSLKDAVDGLSLASLKCIHH